MSYYLFNRQEILEKEKKRYSKEKAAEYYLQNKEFIKVKRQGIVIRTCQKKAKTKSKSMKRKGIKN